MKLEDIYSDQAQHFHHTRKRPWPEMDYISPYMQHIPKNGSLVDLGCGAGRVFPWLQEIGRGDILYTGVDNASGFTLLAQDLYPDTNFVCEDMNSYIRGCDQQSVDAIVAIASIQHLNLVSKRQELFNNAYRALEYRGVFCMTNRAFSDRFLQKYWKQCLFAQYQSVVSLGRWKWNDLSIPWKDPDWKKNGKIYQRYYHMFSLGELRSLALQAGFSVEKLGFVAQDGSWTIDWRKARNSVMVLRK